MKLVLFGAPGAGKGTVAKIMIKDFKIPQISTGDLFRKAIKEQTELGKKVSSILASGGLVPDELTIDIVKERTNEADCKNGFILDGFPRTMVQAEAWEKANPIDKAIYFDISDEEVKKRLCGRRVCPKCGEIYNINFNQPKVEGVCDKDGEKLIIRSDDEESAIVNRLEVYHSQTEPLLKYYSKLGKVISVNSSVSPDFTYKQIKENLNIK
jgi:adenylate kinase